MSSSLKSDFKLIPYFTEVGIIRNY